MLKIVKTENGLVRGLPAADPRVISFKGIPFAAPPVGELRWKAPQPAADWEGVRDCLDFAPISMQSSPGLDEENIYTREWNVDPSIPMSEDCLPKVKRIGFPFSYGILAARFNGEIRRRWSLTASGWHAGGLWW